MEIDLFNSDGDFLENIKIRHIADFILYRGRLFEKFAEGKYEQREYVEVY